MLPLRYQVIHIPKKNILKQLNIQKTEEKYDVNTKPKSDLIAEKNFSRKWIYSSVHQ